MKKLLLYALLGAFALPVLADLPSNGFYRIQNAYTKRYAYLLDNKGSVNVGSTSADVGALELFLDQDKKVSDPSTIFYIEQATSNKNKYNISGQGTNLYSFFNEYVNFIDGKAYDGKSTVMVYASNSGVVRYLGDKRSNLSAEEGMPSVDCKGDDRKWYLNTLEPEGDDYFGVTPTLEADGKYYHPLYTSFPFSAYSEGVKFYAVTEIDPRGAVLYKEIEGSIPAGTPVIVECASASPSDNRLNIGVSASAVSGNLLKGVYFDNPERAHFNRTAFDKETMRVLGVKDGRLAFVEGDYEYLPRNQAYLQLTDPASYSVKEFPLMTPEEHDEFVANYKDPNDTPGDVDIVSAVDGAEGQIIVYTSDGRMVGRYDSASDLSALPRGLYLLHTPGGVRKIMK